MKTILHVINGDLEAGAETVQKHIASGFKEKSDFRIIFLSLKPGIFYKKLLDEYTNNAFSVLEPDFCFLELLQREGVNIVHLHTPRSLLFITKFLVKIKKAKVKVIYHYHSPTLHCTNRVIRNVAFHLLEVAIVRFLDAVITVSNSLNSYVRKKIAAKVTVETIHNSVPSLPIIKSLTDTKNYNLLFVALIRERKGLDDLVIAIEKCKKIGLNINVHVVGNFESTEYERKIKLLIETKKLSDNFHFKGFMSTPLVNVDLYDFLVLPSKKGEGLPMVILEALSAGLPVICTLVEGNEEAVFNNINGLTCKPNDSDDMAKVLQVAYSDHIDYVKMQKSSREVYLSKFSLLKYIRDLESLYERI